MNGVSYDGKSITIDGQRYTRTEFHSKLREIVHAMQSDMKSPYRDSKHPLHEAVKTELTLAYRWMNGDIDQATEAAIAGTWSEATTTTIQETNEMASPDVEIMRELAAIVKDPKQLAALNKWRASGDENLTPDERAIVDRHNQLEQAHNVIAAAERKSIDPPKPLDRYVGKDVWAWSRHPDRIQRQQLAAEHRAKVMGDPKHPYWDPKSTEHKAAVLGVKAAIETMQTGESSVKIADDGTISDGE